MAPSLKRITQASGKREANDGECSGFLEAVDEPRITPFDAYGK